MVLLCVYRDKWRHLANGKEKILLDLNALCVQEDMGEVCIHSHESYTATK